MDLSYPVTARRSGRVAEGGALLRRYVGRIPAIEETNPSFSVSPRASVARRSRLPGPLAPLPEPVGSRA